MRVKIGVILSLCDLQGALEKMQKSASFQRAMLKPRQSRDSIENDSVDLDEMGKEDLQRFEEPLKVRLKVSPPFIAQMKFPLSSLAITCLSPLISIPLSFRGSVACRSLSRSPASTPRIKDLLISSIWTDGILFVPALLCRSSDLRGLNGQSDTHKAPL